MFPDSVTQPTPLPQRTINRWMRHDPLPHVEPVADALRATLESAHPERILPLGVEIAQAARIALGRLAPLAHSLALDAAQRAMDQQLDRPVITARDCATAAVYAYLHALTDESL